MNKPAESADLPLSSDMFCRTCRYDLRGLREPRCPECGTAFDPDDASTFFRKPPPPERLSFVLTVIAAGYPVVTLSTIYATWFAARIVLGERPHLYGDQNPPEVGGIVSGTYRLTAPCLGYGLCPMFCLACLMGFYHVLRTVNDISDDRLVTRRAVRRGLAIVLAWAVMGVASYFRIVNRPFIWFIDFD